MPRKPKSAKRRVIFKDGLGRFVKAEDRYKKATTVQVLRRGRYVTVMSETTVTPQKLAIVTSRPEFESLPPAFKHVKRIIPPKKGKDRTWKVAQDIAGARGTKDKLLKLTVKFKTKGRTRTVSFFHKLARRRKTNYSLFKHLKEATEGVQVPFWYDITEEDIPKLTKDKTVIEEVEIEEVM